MHRRGIEYADHRPPRRFTRPTGPAQRSQAAKTHLHAAKAADGSVVVHLHQGSTPHHAMKRGTHRMKLPKDSLIRTVRRRAVAVLGAVVLLAGIRVSAASVAQAASGTGPITGYQGLCLDDRSASTALFNPIQVYTCNGTNAQQWTVESNGTLEVLGMCLDVNGAGTAHGTLVHLYTCNLTAAHQ